MVNVLTKEHLCTIYGHKQQCGDWLGEGRGWDWVEVRKRRKCENCNRINYKNKIKK